MYVSNQIRSLKYRKSTLCVAGPRYESCEVLPREDRHVVAILACEVTVILTQKRLCASLCEDFSDLTNPSSNHIPFVNLAIAPVHDTFLKILFLPILVHIL